MVTREKRMTVQEFFDYTGLPENEGRRLELEDGIITEMAGSRPINTIVAGNIVVALHLHVMPHNLGHVTLPDARFVLNDGTVRMPDVGFVSIERYATVPERFEGGPDIAIEVVSPNEDVLNKALEYIDAGTSIVWAVYPDPDKRLVHVLRPGKQWVVLGIGDVLDGGTVLPDLRLPLKDIFRTAKS